MHELYDEIDILERLNNCIYVNCEEIKGNGHI